MKKQIAVGLISFFVTLFVIGGFTIVYISLIDNDKPKTTEIKKNDIAPDKKEFCDTISAGEMKNITGVTYKKPMSTKSVVTTGLSSQTCAYIAAKSADSVQIVLKYQTSENSTPTIEENWQTLKEQNKANYLKSTVSDEAFITQNTLYVFENKQIITVTSSLKMSLQEQIAKELL
jgi:hypothetical protein